jgi:hypothetical protein
MYGFTWTLSVLVGLLSLADGAPVSSAAGNAVASAVPTLGVWTFIYCSRASFKEVKFAGQSIPRRLAIAVGLLALWFALGLSTTRIEAAVINRRLQGYARRRQMDESDIDTLISTLKYVREARIQIDPRAASAIGERMLRIDPSSVPTSLAKSAFQAAAASANVQTILGAKPSSRPLTRQHPAITPFSLFEQCVFPNLDLELDTRAFRLCTVYQCNVFYRGGPLVLNETKFEECTFHIEDTQQGRALLLLLTKSSEPEFCYMPEEIGPFSLSCPKSR